MTAPDRDSFPPGVQTAPLRQRIEAVFATDADFCAFCQDHFPEVFARFASGMERKQKVNLLLECLSSPTEREQLDLALSQQEQLRAARRSQPLFPSPTPWRRRWWIPITLALLVGVGLAGYRAWSPLGLRSGSLPTATAPAGPATRTHQADPPEVAPLRMPSPPPVLLLETGMHRGTIDHLSVDVHGRFLVTGSRDKTVRLWDVGSTKLLATYYPPFGPGHRGKIFAVAISPEGTTIAAAGSTSSDSDESFHIYLFDRESGKLSTIPGLPTVIYDLKFSLDGTRIAAVLRNGDLRVFRVRGGIPDGVHSARDGHATGVDFDRSGRVVTSDLDGSIHLYDATLSHRQTVKRLRPPYSVRFSPDGRMLAVGYSDIGLVDVLSARDLKPLFRPTLTGIGEQELPTIAWSSDGAELCAAGRWQVRGQSAIRCWSKGGRGAFRDTPVANHWVLDLATLPDGRLAFASADPGWGILGEGYISHFQAAHTADFQGGQAAFRVNRDGQRLRFAYRRQGQAASEFSLSSRTLTSLDRPDSDEALQPARTTSARFRVSGWQGTSQVRLDDIELPMTKHEVAMSLAIAHDDAWFVLGTERYLRCFSAHGRQLWETPVPGESDAVNISGDDRLVVAAFHDGTIRWYSARDGSELLALFPHADRRRYVLFTPEGFYDSLPDAEDLIRWYDTATQTQPALVAPAAKYRALFHSPERVSASLRLAQSPS